jgi:hypothetical protein
MALPHYLLLLFIGAATGQAVAGAPGANDPVQLKPVTILFDIDPAGQASGFACKAGVPAQTCAAVLAAASRWRYAAGKSGGKPAAMRTSLTLRLQALPQAGGYALRAIGASLGEASDPATSDAEDRKLKPPRYPRDAMLGGRTAHVVLEQWYEPGTGHARVRNAWVGGKPARRYDEFVTSATRAAETWKVDAGAGKALSFCTAIYFQLDRKVPVENTEPCQPSYIDGYMPPRLLTKTEQMTF